MHKRMFSSSLSKAVVGFQSEIRKSFAATELKAFAKLSDDHNPLHFDESFAKTTRFKQPIVHGMLVSSLFSGLIATQWPGNAIYLKQDLKFKAPVFVNEEIKAKIMVENVENRKIYLSTIVSNLNETEIKISGNALILIDE